MHTATAIDEDEREETPDSAGAPVLPERRGVLRRIAEEEYILVVLLAGFALIFLLIFPPALIVNDSWLNLMAGREVVENGLPSVDELTIYGLGATWTDQQWLAQVFMYGVFSLGGFALLSIVACAFVVGAFTLAAAASRSLGAGPRAIWLLFLPVLISAALGWSIRAQMLTLPLYTGLLWLLASQARRPTQPRLDRAAAARPLGEHARERRARRAARDAPRRVRAPAQPRQVGAAEHRPDRAGAARDPRHPVRPGDDGPLLPPPPRRSAVRRTGDGVAAADAGGEHRGVLRPPRDRDPDRRSGVAAA